MAQAEVRQVRPTAPLRSSLASTTGRGEAQTLRLSMLYALLDRSPVIDVPHLEAAHAVWNYCDDSASIIFQQDDDDDGDPLQKHLLKMIRKTPGLTRTDLHRQLGGHVPADTLVKALAALRDRKLAHCETESTGGRPAERWFPSNPVDLVFVDPNDDEDDKQGQITEATPNDPGAGDCERTKKVEATDEDLSSLVHTFSMAELLQAVNGIGGRFVRQGDLVVVDAPDDAVTDEIRAAVNEYQSALLELLPESTATGNDDGDKLDQEMEDFIHKLANIDPMQPSNGRFTKSWLESSPESKA